MNESKQPNTSSNFADPLEHLRAACQGTVPMPEELSLPPLKNLDWLTALPAKIHSKGEFTVKNCPNLASLPSSIKAKGGVIDLSGNTALKAFPETLELEGVSLRVQGARALQRIGSIRCKFVADEFKDQYGGTSVNFLGGKVEITRCSSLEEITGSITADYGELALTGNTQLKRIAGPLAASSVDLSGCTALENEPEIQEK